MGGPLNGSKTGIVIPTLIQTSNDLLRYWTGMTCLYDVQWTPESDRATLPICMFHVNDIHEISKTDISSKRVIMYEPQSSNTAVEMASRVRPSILRAVVDNAFKNPKQYNLDVVLPFMPVDRSMKDYAGILSGAVSMFASLISESAMSAALASYTSGLGVDLAHKMIDTLSGLPNSSGVAYMNKNSLDAMWDRTHFLCMKMWTGYDYKFVMISNMDISKKPTEDDVFRGSIQVQEMPVLSANRPKSVKINNVSANPIVQIISSAETALSDILVTATGVDVASK
jgi:hypothetical protein